MSDVSSSGELFHRECLICSRPAICRNYGVTSCDACKMFFCRTVLEQLRYVCKKDNRCMDRGTPKTKPLCRGCRFQKCLELGMELFPSTLGTLDVGCRKSEDFTKILRDLLAMKSNWYFTLMNFYTEDDPGLEEILNGEKAIMIKKPLQQPTSREQWTFFSNYILISLFTNFSFVQKLTSSDKLALFQSTAAKNYVFCSAMRSVKGKRDRLCNPDGQEIYPEYFARMVNVEPRVLRRVCSQLVSRMIELHVTDEEFVLLLLIYFWNPALPSLSEDGQSVLATDQKMYTSVLFQLCQNEHQRAAPSRLTDLLSLYQVINKNYEDFSYIRMVFQFYVPYFKFRKLINDTLQ